MEEFVRTELLIGKDNLEKLNKSNVLLFGVGGVGGACLEALARSGILNITIVDADKVSISNINRQIIALGDNVGRNKVDVAEERIKSICKNINVEKLNMFYLPDNSNIDFTKYDYVIDCIDTISAKIDIVKKCYELNVPIISCMGMGNKLNPLDIRITDIYKTTTCPLARVMRYELRKRNVKKLKVCYSIEEPKKPVEEIIENGKAIPASISFVPPVAGYIIASEVIKDIINK